MPQQLQPFWQNRFLVLGPMALTLVVALLFAGSAMTQSTPANPPAQQKAAAGKIVPVKITPGVKFDDPPTVLPATVELDPNDEVEWTCTTKCEFDVTFGEAKRKPFKDRAFNKLKSKSGKPTGAVGKYKYSVFVGGGVLDPDVIIR